MSITITNLTPHPVTIIRRLPDGTEQRTEYPACRPSDLPRAIEGGDWPADLAPSPSAKIGSGLMALTDSGSDGQGGYENACSLASTCLVDFVGYVGVENLPLQSVSDRMFGFDKFWIVSVVTVLGAVAAGRGIEDLLVPMGQVRDATGRIVGASGLAPATTLMSPLYRRWTAPLQRETIKALRERNEARKTRTVTLTNRPPVQIVESEWPVIASARGDSYHGDPGRYRQAKAQGEVDVYSLHVRQHADGRVLVYGVLDAAIEQWNQPARGRSHKAGQVIGPNPDLALAIERIAAALGPVGDLAAECIADLPPEQI